MHAKDIQRKRFRVPMQDLLASNYRCDEGRQTEDSSMSLLNFTRIQLYRTSCGCIVERQYKSFVNFGLKAGKGFSLS